MTSLEDINDPTEAMNASLILFAKAFQLSAPTNNNQRTSSNPRNCQLAQLVMNMGQDRKTQNVRGNGRNQFGQYAGQVAHNQQGFNAWQNGITNQSGTGKVVAARAEGTGNGNQARIDIFRMLEEMAGISLDSMLVKWHRISKGLMHSRMVGFKSGTSNVVAARDEGTGIGNQARCYNCRGLGHIARNYPARPRRRDAAYLQTQLLIAQKEEAGIQLQGEEFDFMAAADDLDEIEEVNANCILMENL
nr:hypothetical protein [Tanacetum cinerariifolium]